MGSTRNRLIFLTFILLFLSCGARSNNINRSVYGAYSDIIDSRNIIDTDGDGVRDYWDQCPSQARGLKPIDDGKNDYTTRFYYWSVGCPFNTVRGK
jgi:hypothetical protein